MTVHSVCVYCGSSGKVDEAYKQIARDVGTALGSHKLRVVYGGGRVGLMGLVADSALAAGSEVVGIIPHHIQSREIQHTDLTELLVVDSMHTRKRMMVERADAFVILPGGLGTLDECFEILTWRQLGLHNKPIVIFNAKDFWTPLLGLLDNVIDQGFAPPGNRGLYSVVKDIDGMFTALGRDAEPSFDPATKWM